MVVLPNVAESTDYRIKRFQGAGLNAIPSHDEQQWYVYTMLNWNLSQVLVYDVARDTVVNSLSLVPGIGDMALTPRGDRLYFTNFGGVLSSLPAPSEFYYYDVRKGQFGEITPVGAVTSSGDTIQHMVMQLLAVSPDGRYVTVSGYRDAGIVVYDATRDQFVRCFAMEPSTRTADVTCNTVR